MITADELREISDRQISVEHDAAEKAFIHEMERIEESLKKAALSKVYKTTVSVDDTLFGDFGDEYITKIAKTLHDHKLDVNVTVLATRCINGPRETKFEISWAHKSTKQKG